MEATTVTDFSKWPAIDDAYLFVLPSYQLIAARYEAADTRLMALMTWASTVTLGVPIFARSIRPDIDFRSPAFLGGVLMCVAIFIVGIVGRIAGTLILPDPGVMYGYLHEPSDEFKKNAIFLAGKHMNANADAVRLKGNITVALSVALLIEVTAFVFWLAH
jgi:hypothetical protein